MKAFVIKDGKCVETVNKKSDYMLLDKHLNSIDKIVVRGEVCNVTAVMKDAVLFKFPNAKAPDYMNISMLKKTCSFVHSIVEAI